MNERLLNGFAKIRLFRDIVRGSLTDLTPPV